MSPASNLATAVGLKPPDERPARTGVAQVLRYYELVDQGDVPGLVGLFEPDAVYCRPGYEPMVGHDGLTEFYRDQRVIREGRHIITDVVAASSQVAVRGEFNGVLHDGRAVSLRFSDFFEIGDGGAFRRRDTYFFAPLV